MLAGNAYVSVWRLCSALAGRRRGRRASRLTAVDGNRYVDKVAERSQPQQRYSFFMGHAVAGAA